MTSRASILPDNKFSIKLLLTLLFLLIVGIYWEILFKMGLDWYEDPNYSHGFFVPLFSAYVAWQKKDELTLSHGHWLGLPVLLFGMGILVLGQVGSENFLSRSSFVVILSGLIIFNFGLDCFRQLSFPVLFLFLMIPLPAIVFNQITFPLQQLAARNAAWALKLAGIPVLLDGNVIHLSHGSLGVTEACSGIRSLISLVTLSVIFAHLSMKRMWEKVVLVVSSLPITIFSNGFRIVVTAYIAQNYGMEYAEGFYHGFAGWIIFVVSFLLLFFVYKLIKLFGKHALRYES